jgi:ribosomal protein L37AE/L43A
MAKKIFHCEECNRPTHARTLAAKDGKWVCADCALAKSERAFLNPDQIRTLQEQQAADGRKF